MRQPAGVERGQRDLEARRPPCRAGSRPGTRTWWKRVTPFSMPRSPMKALRCSTVMPGESRLDDERGDAAAAARRCSGTRAITTSRSATTPLVVHSFTPSRRYAVAVRRSGVAVVASRAGSEPTSGSVSRNARDRAGGAAGQERLLLLGGADQLHRLGHADRLVGRQQRADARVRRADEHQRLAVVRHASGRARRTRAGSSCRRRRARPAP